MSKHLETSSSVRLEKQSQSSLSGDNDSVDSLVTARLTIEKKLRHKFDRRVLPIGILIFLMAQIDRSNMSNAAVLGMSKDLDLQGNSFNISLTLFFVTYVVFEIPANMLCKRFGPRIWLSFITFGFGITTMCMAFIQNYTGLIVCRVLLGIFESGVQPGLMYAYAQFYRRHELASRWGIKAAGASISGAIGGLLGSGLGNIPQAGILVRWRWIFLVEGIITSLVAGGVYYCMPNEAGTASFLTEDERKVATERIAEENKAALAAEDLSPWRLDVLRAALWNINTQLVSLCLIMSLLSLTALSLFMPSLLKSMGFSSTNAQLLTVPPYVLAACICIGASFLSDRFHTRGFIIVGLTPLTIVGFLLLAIVSSTSVRYFALFLVTPAAFTCSPLLLAWLVGNSAGPSVRAIVSAYAVGEGNIGAIIATWTYLAADAPRYVRGHWINLGGGCVLLLVAGITTLYLRWENRRRAKGERDNRLMGLSEQQIWQLGHRHPEYRYTA